MRTSLRRIACGMAALALTFICQPLWAQGQPRTAARPANPAAGPMRTVPAASQIAPDASRAVSQAGPGSKIAVIDIGVVFKNHNRFKQAMEGMRKEVEAFEAILQQHGAELQKKRAKLQELRPGSADYNELEREMASFQAQVQADTQLKRKEFLQEEAKIYYNVYSEIVKEVSYFAQQQGIDLVVRFNSEEIDPEDRKSVLEGVNRAVVYQQHLNITNHILDRINGPATARPAAAAPRR